MYQHCSLCPRQCFADRGENKTGYCGQTSALRVARAALHFWEEPCLSGEKGSGTVFFCGCSLKCIFCQNSRISLGGSQTGRELGICELADTFLALEEQGANNINLVTGTHYVPQIAVAIVMARHQGLSVPVVYNTSGYETTETLKLLDGLVDIYLPDMKYMSPSLAEEYSHAGDYFPVAAKAVKEMVRQVGRPVFDEQGLMKKGVIVRHLVLPGSTKDSRDVIRYLLNTYGNDIYVSIMNQYTPMEAVKDHPLLKRRVTPREYEKVVNYALDLGLEQGFIQEGETSLESFIPDFNL
jgi:putative pyruvate formate lyase activating enzyme